MHLSFFNTFIIILYNSWYYSMKKIPDKRQLKKQKMSVTICEEEIMTLYEGGYKE